VSVARYRLAHGGASAADSEIIQQRLNGFVWMRELYDLFGAYEADRQRYPDLDAFAPRIAEYWRGLPARLPALVAQVDATRPHIVSMTPANGSTDVDPAVTTLTLRFDRPMHEATEPRRDIFAGDSSVRFPELRGDASYDSTRTVLTIPVRLAPGASYAIALGGRGLLARTVIRFHVRPTASR
jgi:hypothetical protein